MRHGDDVPDGRGCGADRGGTRIAPLVRACRDEGERERRLPAQVLAAMHEARLFRMYIPKALDGRKLTRSRR